MTTTIGIDDYRIPSDQEVVSYPFEATTRPSTVGERLSEAALAEALLHAAPRHDVDPTVVDHSRIEIGSGVLRSAATVPTPERFVDPTNPQTLYAYSFYTTSFRRQAIDELQQRDAA